MKLDDFVYELPESRIATHPVEPRDHCKLMVIHRADGKIEHRRFDDLAEYFTPRDLLVLNDTKVIPARLHANNGQIEILLIEETSPRHWLCIGKPGKKLKPQTELWIDPLKPGAEPAKIEILKSLPSGERVIRFFKDINLADYGELPLPPYIQKQRKEQHEPLYIAQDSEVYQTTYANNEHANSVAAPTAGLHFTPELLQKFNHAFVTLNVGLGTFRPVKVADITEHEMHREHFFIPENLQEKAANSERVVAVGTTVARVLESVPKLKPGSGETNIFMYPPYKFKRVDALITNFHLPGSTLLMLVAAFAGLELQRKAYQEAIANRYRFFSYGDAMLIL
ncbi:MAG: tRNA preQ1(34) S-adenosylmethionine ribosyltransferase-isomerase QueA [Verrucomicrobiales bacterium]|jgi:S-adenosylmethionine:tRNA ribosyltransferase-isomerase|nr:tRNA preQ1(34) S-adenosylmethionine ribosyltransferase-isomerase QueA [Verrucomicrobiales bacterium]